MDDHRMTSSSSIQTRQIILLFVGAAVLLVLFLMNWSISNAAPGFNAQPNRDSVLQNPQSSAPGVSSTLGNLLIIPLQITDTQTSTPTLTLTPMITETVTSTVTPTVTGTLTVTQTTGTLTPTVTGTVTPSTPTPTVTGSPGTPASTVTGTPPTPTATGTIVPSITLSVAVSPSSARINETFTFTIQVRNTGTAPASNALVSDSFSNLLDITGATTTKGTAATNTSNRTVTVSVGTVNPNETVTITITTRVNSSATTTTSQTHTASMTYAYGGVNLSRTSNAVSYTITGSSTLPGTGWGLPAPPQVERSRPIPWLSLVFAVLGLSALVVGLLVRAVRRERVLFFGIGVWLLLMGLVVSPVGASWLQPPEQVAQAPSTVEEVAPASREPESVLQIILPTPEVVETLPDYPVPTPEFTPTPGENGEEHDTSSVERILIPALGVDTVVKYVPYDGFSWKIAGLHQEVAWMGETSWPGLGGNTALAGHITLRDGGNGPFRYLEDIVPGDQVTLFTEKKIYTYQVREQRVVPQTDLSVVRPTDATQLTLITCTGWDPAVRYYQDRLVVVADLLQVEPRVIAAIGN